MPRKPLVGKSKLLTTPPSTPEHNDALRVAVAIDGDQGAAVGGDVATGKSTNGSAVAPRQKREKLHLTTPKRKPPKVTNFRLGEPDLANLRELVRVVQELSPYRQISATSIVKALLQFGRSVPPERILEALKETL